MNDAEDSATAPEALGSAQLPDSERYHGDSERYQQKQDIPGSREHQEDPVDPVDPVDPDDSEDSEFPWLAESPAWDRDDFADEWMPDRALGEAAAGVDGLEPNRREWQVNIRLDRERYAALRRAAEVYGTSPTALARMLLNRGSQAILSAYRTEMATFDQGNRRR